ncbi:unnamed protein product [Blepharisma stoltei]|uniref:U-box domain-containing protein n=1 Tax=Blepharisma stoltei TaxID=1481888 RepID=A0AAU9IRH7_9CILI|nr:unnamed protein product [Blepharisma stoltei]
MEGSDQYMPNEYLCPITQELMDDPVIAADGHTYERAAIAAWMEISNANPLTGEELSSRNLTPNYNIKALISDYKEQIRNQPLNRRPENGNNQLLERLMSSLYEHIASRKDYISSIRKSIDALISLKYDLEQNLLNCKISNTSGNAGTVIGTALLFTPFPWIGALALVAGGLTSIGTSIAQHFIEKDRLAQMKKILENEENAANKFYFTLIRLDKSIEATKGAAQALLMTSKIKNTTIFIKAYNHFKAARAANAAYNSAKTANAAKAINFPKLMRIGPGAKILGAAGAALSVADIVLTWTMNNDTLEQIKVCLAEREELIDLQEKELKQLENLVNEKLSHN